MPGRGRPKKTIGNSVHTPRQQYFPARRTTVSSKKHLSSAPSSIRQQTLTQIDFVSRYTPDDEDFDLEYVESAEKEEGTLGSVAKEVADKSNQGNERMPKESKGRISVMRPETQATPTSSVKSGYNGERMVTKREEKILYHTPRIRDNEDIAAFDGAFDDDDDDDEDYVVGSKRKRGKGLPKAQPVSIIQTRSAKRKALAAEEAGTPSKSTSVVPANTEARPSTNISSAADMAPLKTPQRTKRTEIPSSTSTEEPVSSHSRVNGRFGSRSPLVGLSTNTRRKIDWSKTFEIQDSYDQEGENFPPSQVNYQLRSDEITPEATPKKAPRFTAAPRTPKALNEQRFEQESQRSQQTPSRRQRPRTREIDIDEGEGDEGEECASEEKEEKNGDNKAESVEVGEEQSMKEMARVEVGLEEEEDDDDFGVGLETQVAFVHASNFLGDGVAFETMEKLKEESLATPPVCDTDNNGTPTPKASQKPTIFQQRSAADEVSAQLEAELQRYAQTADQKRRPGPPPLSLQTESQIEAEFHDFPGPSAMSFPDPQSPPVLQHPHGQPHTQFHTQSQARGLEASTPSQYNRRQMLDFDFALPTLPTPFKDPIPLSQATTTDVTQPSPTQHSIHHSTPPRTSALVLSSPPRLLSIIPNTSVDRPSPQHSPIRPRSSSPQISPGHYAHDDADDDRYSNTNEPRLDDNEDDIGLQDSQKSTLSDLGIDHLIESQLLPESLMRDSGHRAPVWGESDYRRVWDDEDLEDMEYLSEESVEGNDA